MNKKTTDAVAVGIAEDFKNENSEKDLIRLSTGVVLKAKPVSTFVLTEVTRRHKRPRPPVVMDEDRGRNMENPSDPVYLDEISEWESNVASSTMGAIILFGTEIKSVPKDFQTPDEEDWIDELDVIEINIDRNNKKARYLSWVKYIAAPQQEDLEKIMSSATRLTGVMEDDVNDAVESFRDDAE